MTIADPELFSIKNKLITYTRVFVDFYNQRNCKQVYKIPRIVELESWHTSTTQNICIFGLCCVIEISLVLHSKYVMAKNKEKTVFYINTYINWNQFNQLYNPDWLNKDI